MEGPCVGEAEVGRREEKQDAQLIWKRTKRTLNGNDTACRPTYAPLGELLSQLR